MDLEVDPEQLHMGLGSGHLKQTAFHKHAQHGPRHMSTDTYLPVIHPVLKRHKREGECGILPCIHTWAMTEEKLLQSSCTKVPEAPIRTVTQARGNEAQLYLMLNTQ